jgi:hypothetical protein
MCAYYQQICEKLKISLEAIAKELYKADETYSQLTLSVTTLSSNEKEKIIDEIKDILNNSD